MVYLQVNFNLCNNCKVCEKIVNGFISIYDGIIPISYYRYTNQEDIKQACSDVINSCELKAISLIKEI